MQLFRPEAVEAQKHQWLGRVQLVQPLSVRLMTGGALLALAAVLAFLWFGEYTRKAPLPGVLVPDRGLIRLVPTAAGTVVERRAVEGQSVKAGDLLFVLAVDRPMLDAGSDAQVRASLDERRRSLRVSSLRESELAAQQQTALERRLQALALELAQLETESVLHRRRMLLAEESLARLETLRADQFVSPAQVQAKGEEVIALQSQLQGLERQRAALGRERAELDGEKRGLPLKAQVAQGGIERELASLVRETAEQDAGRRLLVRAPADGVVSAVFTEPGQSVNAASALASLVPAGAALQAQLYAPSSAVGFVRPGQTVRLRFEAFPYQRFGHQPAHVLQVSRAPLAAAELAALALPAAVVRADEPLFRITVALDSADAPVWPQPLVAGMRLQADVLLERRRLVQWLFAPLMGLAQRL